MTFVTDAGCSLKDKLSSHGENLLIASLYLFPRLDELRYSSLVAFLVEQNVDPGQIDDRQVKCLGILSYLFKNCGCHFFDYINRRCSLDRLV